MAGNVRMTEFLSTPLLLVGAGRLGSALIRGWSRVQAIDPAGLMIVEPQPGDAARGAAKAGAALNPPSETLAEARTVVLAVKPQLWRQVAAGIEPHLAPDAVIVSVAAGVRVADLTVAFGGRAVARTLPTTAVEVGQGAAAIFAHDEAARRMAHAVLDPVAATVDLDDEALMDAAIGISGSAPGFFYAFVEALEAAGEVQGLTAEASRRLARATIAGAAALMAESGRDPADLKAEVASPGGTTEAGLAVLTGEPGLSSLLREAVAAAAARARQLGG